MEKHFRLPSFLAVLVFVIIFSINFGGIDSLCLVEERSSKEAKPCIFPFIFADKPFYACTNETLLNGELWCSTKVNDGGVHVGKIGYWGFCDMTNPSCRGEPEVLVTTVATRQVTPEVAETEKVNVVSTEATLIYEDLGTWKPSAERGECGSDISGNQFIVGGEDVDPGEFPFMALLGYEKEGKIKYLCGGTLLNKLYVLTAAHCHSPQMPVFTVRLGERILGQDPDCVNTNCSPLVIDISVANVKQHENWIASRINRGFDIALVRLAEMAALNGTTVSPVCLPWVSLNPGLDLEKAKEGTVTGWGKITNNETIIEDNLIRLKPEERSLQEAKVPLLEDSICQEKLGDRASIFDPEKFICAGGVNGIGACGGDSGGPLIYQLKKDEAWFQIGITSFGSRECGKDFPTFFTEVVYYLDWIEKHMLP